jgi:hypothetical protein
MPGIRRKRVGKYFRYIAMDRSLIRDEQESKRIRGLVIPPAWTDVWICPLANGHPQAIGRDAQDATAGRRGDISTGSGVTASARRLDAHSRAVFDTVTRRVG